MSAREFLIKELGDDLPNSMGVKICNLLDKYLNENRMDKIKMVKVAKGPSGHWYEKKIGKTYKVIEFDATTESYLVEVSGFPSGRHIYENDCELTVWNSEEFMTIEKEKESFSVPEHYDNENGSLYLFAEQHDLNAWEFDIVKRIVRCREKGQFKEDLEKTKLVIDLYLKEYELD